MEAMLYTFWQTPYYPSLANCIPLLSQIVIISPASTRHSEFFLTLTRVFENEIPIIILHKLPWSDSYKCNGNKSNLFSAVGHFGLSPVKVEMKIHRLQQLITVKR